MPSIIETITDTISQKPEIGIFSSMAGVALSPLAIISLASAVLGLVVTVITLIIKIVDMVDKMHMRKHHAVTDDMIMIGNKLYKRMDEVAEEK